MVKLTAEVLKGELPRLALYVAIGLAVFTVVRTVVAGYGLPRWQITVIPLMVMFIVLETLTTLGWLMRPFGGPPRTE